MILLAQLFDRRIRGFRVIEVAALLALVAMVLWVYTTKAAAGREGYEIGEVQKQILDERRALKQLRAENAHLEEYKRIEALSHTYLGLAPVKAAHETGPDGVAVAVSGGGRP